jgi:hypothetical protein
LGSSLGRSVLNPITELGALSMLTGDTTKSD